MLGLPFDIIEDGGDMFSRKYQLYIPEDRNVLIKIKKKGHYISVLR
jgi:hypothetical protein